MRPARLARSRTAHRAGLALAVALPLTLPLAGCGQKGPLYLPDPRPQSVPTAPAATPPEAPPAAAPATEPTRKAPRTPDPATAR